MRSEVEDRWRQPYQDAGSGELGALRSADPGLVKEDSALLAAALRRVLDRLPDGGPGAGRRAQPTNRGGGAGLDRRGRRANGEGRGVLVVDDEEDTRVEPLD
jgi:hypothetical protein